MTIKELERDRVQGTKPEKKIEPPKKYQVILHQPVGLICGCEITILTQVFKMAGAKPIFHAIEAAQSGKAIVYQASKDEAETKAEAANKEIPGHVEHNPLARMIKFTCEQV